MILTIYYPVPTCTNVGWVCHSFNYLHIEAPLVRSWEYETCPPHMLWWPGLIAWSHSVLILTETVDNLHSSVVSCRPTFFEETMQLTCNNTTYLKGNVNATAQALLLFTVDFRKLILKWAVDHWLFCTHQGYNIKTSNVIVLLESCQFISFLFWIQCSYKMAFCTLCTLSLRWIFAFPVYIHIGKTKVSR